jgi:hypothetical protein
LLEKAIAADPNFPLAHAALAAAWHSLGYDARAKQEAEIALEHAAKLPREARLIIEAQAHSENDRFAQSAEIDQALWRFYPDNLDYAMRAASALISAGRAKEALVIVDGLKKTWNDPRVDLAEADASGSGVGLRAGARRGTARRAEGEHADCDARRGRVGRLRTARTSRLGEARAAFDDSKRR